MLKGYLKITIRKLLKHRVYTLINISGLIVGVTCCLLILMYVRFELSYDRHHENSDRVYRLVSERKVGATVENLANVPFIAGPVFASNFPEILQSTRLFRATNGASVNHLDRLFAEQLFFFSDPNIFDVFTF